MSATIPESMRLDDLLKATGYDCPAELQGKTFDQATEGGGADLEDNKTVSITENGVVEITPTTGKDGMKKVTATVNVSGGGGDVPTEWYLWQDNIGNYRYLPFETAPDTLDSMQYIMIGDSLTSDTSLSTMEIASYIKISDSSFGIGKASYNRITEDVPIGGGGADLEDNKTVSITENGVVEITPTAGKDGMKKVTATVVVPPTEISNLNTSAEIPATVGTSQAMTMVNPPDTPVSLVYIQSFGDGQGSGALSHSVSIADILANGSATLELEIGPGKLTCTVTAVADRYHITVTFEIASVASDYYGGSIRGVVV